MIIVKLYFLKYTILKYCIFLDIIISNNFQKLKNKQYKMSQLNRQDMVVIYKTVLQFFLIQYAPHSQKLNLKIIETHGKNGPLPSILEIICSETLFPNYIAMYHFFGPIAAFSCKIFL